MLTSEYLAYPLLQVSAEKQDYDIVKIEEGGHDFMAIKLSKLTVSITQGLSL